MIQVRNKHRRGERWDEGEESAKSFRSRMDGRCESYMRRRARTNFPSLNPVVLSLWIIFANIQKMLCVKRRRKKEETDDDATQNYLVEVRKKFVENWHRRKETGQKPAAYRTNYPTQSVQNCRSDGGRSLSARPQEVGNQENTSVDFKRRQSAQTKQNKKWL